MRLSLFVALIGLAVPAESESTQQQTAQPGSTAADFRRIIEAAKSRVYPALIFVKPIKEEFSAGNRSAKKSSAVA